MTSRAWRIVKAKYAATAFSGDGARKFGGRWNSPGVAMVYVAGSRSLAMLEMLVHLSSDDLLKRYVLFEIEFDETIVIAIDPAKLPKVWRKSPRSPLVQRIGDEWVARGSSAVLRVPSVIVPTESNYLLNPAHTDFGRIEIGAKQPMLFDPRLIKTP